MAQERTFRYRVLWWGWIAYIAGAFGTAFWSIAFAYGYYLSSTPVLTASVPIKDKWEMLIGAVFFVCASVVFCYAFIRQLLEVRSGSVRVDADGITITNWRSEETHIGCSDITEVSMIDLRGLVRPCIRIVACGKRFNISTWLEDQADLMAMIHRRTQ